MIKTQGMVNRLSPVELETIDRVLKRLNERLLLRNIDKEDACAVAATLYRCGFTREDQLLGQLATALAAPVVAGLARKSASPGAQLQHCLYAVTKTAAGDSCALKGASH